MLALWYIWLGMKEYQPDGSKGKEGPSMSNENEEKPSSAPKLPDPPKRVESPKPPEPPKKVEPAKLPEPAKVSLPKPADPPKPSAQDLFLAAERTFGPKEPSPNPDSKQANIMKNFRITTPETSDDEDIISELEIEADSENQESEEEEQPARTLS